MLRPRSTVDIVNPRVQAGRIGLSQEEVAVMRGNEACARVDRIKWHITANTRTEPALAHREKIRIASITYKINGGSTSPHPPGESRRAPTLS